MTSSPNEIPDDTTAEVDAALKFLETGDLKTAVALLERCGADSGDRRVVCGLTRCYLGLCRFEDALSTIDEGMRDVTSSSEGDLWYLHGVANCGNAVGVDVRERATYAFTHCLLQPNLRRPDANDARYRLAALSLQRKDAAMALKWLSQILDDTSEPFSLAELNFFKWQLYDRLGRDETAMQYLAKTGYSKESVSSGEIHAKLGKLAVQQGNYVRGLALLSEATTLGQTQVGDVLAKVTLVVQQLDNALNAREVAIVDAAAARTMQSCYRGHNARKELKFRKDMRDNTAASQIQREWRAGRGSGTTKAAEPGSHSAQSSTTLMGAATHDDDITNHRSGVVSGTVGRDGGEQQRETAALAIQRRALEEAELERDALQREEAYQRRMQKGLIRRGLIGDGRQRQRSLTHTGRERRRPKLKFRLPVVKVAPLTSPNPELTVEDAVRCADGLRLLLQHNLQRVSIDGQRRRTLLSNVK